MSNSQDAIFIFLFGLLHFPPAGLNAKPGFASRRKAKAHHEASLLSYTFTLHCNSSLLTSLLLAVCRPSLCLLPTDMFEETSCSAYANVDYVVYQLVLSMPSECIYQDKQLVAWHKLQQG